MEHMAFQQQENRLVLQSHLQKLVDARMIFLQLQLLLFQVQLIKCIPLLVILQGFSLILDLISNEVSFLNLCLLQDGVYNEEE